MDYLVQLHEELYPNITEDRLRNNEMSEFTIKYELKELEKIIDSNFEDKEKIRAIIHTSSVILLYQPFYDGNTHVAKLFLTRMLDKINYILDYYKIKDMIIIPQIYSHEEETSDIQLERIYDLIENKKTMI